MSVALHKFQIFSRIEHLCSSIDPLFSVSSRCIYMDVESQLSAMVVGGGVL